MKQSLFILGIALFFIHTVSAADYKVVSVTNGGSIEGSVLWKGNIPPLEPIPVLKNQETCGTSKLSPCLQISKNGGVANTVVFLDQITQGKSFSDSKPVIDQKQCEYVPHVLLVPPGMEAEVRNSDPFLHNVHVYEPAKKTLFNLAFPFAGMKVNKKIGEAGDFLSLCDAGHPWMSAHIVIMEHPYYAVTGADGKFVLDQVPPGTYKIKLWHEGIVTIKDTNTPYLSAKPLEITKTAIVTAGKKVQVNFEMSLP